MAIDVDHELSGAVAKKLAGDIVENGTVNMTSYSSRRATQPDRMVSAQDIENTLEAGRFVRAEFDLPHQEWRYRFETGRIGVVIVFDDVDELTVVTTWRNNHG